MSHSLLGADGRTHLKIAAITFVAVAALVIVGLTARSANTTGAVANASVSVLKAGKPTTYSTSEAFAVR
jgi:hypothetical protein